MDVLAVVGAAGNGDLLGRGAELIGGELPKGERLKGFHAAEQGDAALRAANGVEHRPRRIHPRSVAAHGSLCDIPAPDRGEDGWWRGHSWQCASRGIRGV